MQEKPLLSVVVIGRNEGERLAQSLESVKNIQLEDHSFELIYVDSASEDRSVTLAEQFGATVIQLDGDGPTAALARNCGWRKSRGEYVMFLDGDTQLHPQFISHSLKQFENSKIAIVTGHLTERFPEGSLYNRVLDLDWNRDVGDHEWAGGNALVRRKALEEVRGFNSTLIGGEEPELSRRIKRMGYSIIHLDIPMGYHDLNMQTFPQYWRRAIRSGYAYANVAHMLRPYADPFWQWEVKHNLIKGGLTLFFFIFCLLFLAVSPILMFLFLAVNTLLILRTTLRARKKSKDLMTSFLYGIHSHFQHIPMFLGQIKYWFDYYRGKSRKIIEYK